MNSENIQHMIRNCHSKKRCKAVWEELPEINDGFNNEARFCEQCKKIEEVFFWSNQKKVE